MKEGKDQKGITMVALIVTIILLLILASVTTYVGTGYAKSSKDTALQSELEIVKHAVMEQYTQYQVTQDKTVLVGTMVSRNTVSNIAQKIGVTLVTIPADRQNADFYRLSATDLEKIGIQKATDTYLVNYVTGEVINETKQKTSKGSPLYTYGVKNFNID